MIRLKVADFIPQGEVVNHAKQRESKVFATMVASGPLDGKLLRTKRSVLLDEVANDGHQYYRRGRVERNVDLVLVMSITLSALVIFISKSARYVFYECAVRSMLRGRVFLPR